MDYLAAASEWFTRGIGMDYLAAASEWFNRGIGMDLPGCCV